MILLHLAEVYRYPVIRSDNKIATVKIKRSVLIKTVVFYKTATLFMSERKSFAI